MDSFVALSLSNWLDNHVQTENREHTLDIILNYLHDYPETLIDRTWTEILSLAKRYANE